MIGVMDRGEERRENSLFLLRNSLPLWALSLRRHHWRAQPMWKMGVMIFSYPEKKKA
jgi:hypothetical protein